MHLSFGKKRITSYIPYQITDMPYPEYQPYPGFDYNKFSDIYNVVISERIMCYKINIQKYLLN